MAWLIYMTKFSVHGMYRARLVRACLGARRVNRDPDPFTGFDAMDNVRMYKLRPEVVRAVHLAREGGLFRRIITAAKAKAGEPATDPVSTYLVSRLGPDERAL